MIIYDIQCYNRSLEVKLQYGQMKQQRWEESEKRKEEIPKATTNVQRVNWQRLLGSKVFMPGALHIWPWEAASKTHFMQKVLTICMIILETDALLPSLWLFCLVVIHCSVLFCYSYSIVNFGYSFYCEFWFCIFCRFCKVNMWPRPSTPNPLCWPKRSMRPWQKKPARLWDAVGCFTMASAMASAATCSPGWWSWRR